MIVAYLLFNLNDCAIAADWFISGSAMYYHVYVIIVKVFQLFLI